MLKIVPLKQRLDKNGTELNVKDSVQVMQSGRIWDMCNGYVLVAFNGTAQSVWLKSSEVVKEA